ncbi:CSC1-like protein 2 [Daphnia pulex]|uniref:CSC1-like protein 2 n=1 Tax=Daphnia pulex TaxID=6669 RepID=UPI001EDCFD98|nr:CSC1-like protein 2 [Daphnia pulex]
MPGCIHEDVLLTIFSGGFCRFGTSMEYGYACLYSPGFKKFKWRLLTERLDGLEDPPPQLKRSDSSWIDWLTLKIDEEAVGKDGATFLWFQFRLIQVQILMTVLGIVLIVMHHNGDKLGEWPSKTLQSTGLYNIGVNGAHGVICSAILITLAWLMRQHGQDRGVRSLASHDVNSFSTVCNRRWLMISGIPLTTTADSLLEYLICNLDAKGIHQEQIVMAKDVSKLIPVQNQLNFIRNIKQNLNGRVLMGRRFWDLKSWLKPAIGAVSYYNNKEETLSVKKDEIINQLKFTGTVFIRFDSPVEAKATKFAIRRHQSNWLWKCEETNQNRQFRPSEWVVRYAPPGSDINWMHLKNPRPPFWKTLLVWLRVLAIYSIYIFLMAAPATIVHWLHLDGQERSIFWKRFALPTLVSLFTTKLTNWVTGQDRLRHHLSLTKASLASFRSICFLEILLYMIRMMARKPLPLLLAGEFNSDDIRLACVFFPVHGSFLACCIIVNTAGGILMNHLRFDFLWSYTKKWFSFRSEEEKSTYIIAYRIDYDFASNYAELITNFALTSFFIVIFPVISLVSFTFSILRFISDRSALTRIYPVGRIGHNLHQESINMAMRFAIASPLALLIYRRIQLGHGVKLLDPGIVAPSCLLILYATYLLYAHVKSYGVLPTWFCRLTKLRSRNDISNIEDDEEDVVDSLSNIQHEYDPLAQIREQEMCEFNHSSHSLLSTACKDSVPAQLVVC